MTRRTDPILRFWSHVDRTGDCWVWTGTKLNGYGLFRVDPSDARMHRAHRLSLEWATGRSLPSDVYACHRCDNPACVNPDHLFAGTQSDNMRDCFAKGRMPRGAQRSAAKLTVADVRQIRRAVASGRSMASQARRFGISNPTVQSIVHRRKWTWVA